MEVKDAGKKVTRVRRTFQVLLPPPPVAKATVSRKKGFVGTEFGFNASRSEGRHLRYLWYYNIVGKGTGYTELPVPSHVGAQATASFQSAGKKEILLRIEDHWGRADQVVFPIYIADPVQNILTDTPDPSMKSESALLTRSEMIHLLYQELRSIPPYPGTNPFADVTRKDWFYESALQAHRDGLISGNYYNSHQLATADEAEKFIRFWFGKEVDITTPNLTRSTLKDALS